MQLSQSHLSDHVRILEALASTTAGTSDVNGAAIDMKDSDGCIFIYAVGTITDTAVGGIKVQESDDDSTYSDVSGTTLAHATTGDSDKLIIVDVPKGKYTKRYLRAVAERGTANSVVQVGVAIPYGFNAAPTTNAASASVVGLTQV